MTEEPWTEDEDRFLIYYGLCLNCAFGSKTEGYRFVAEHDLSREPDGAIERVKYLRRAKPLFVKLVEREARRGIDD